MKEKRKRVPHSYLAPPSPQNGTNHRSAVPRKNLWCEKKAARETWTPTHKRRAASGERAGSPSSSARSKKKRPSPRVAKKREPGLRRYSADERKEISGLRSSVSKKEKEMIALTA